MSKIQTPNLVALEYQISQLPSSQHRAGLAGLILKIQWLQQQAEFKDSLGAICKIIDLDADKATLQFNLAGITLLFRSHYNAVLEERESTKIRPNGSKNYLTIEREVYDPDTDRTELVKSYIYQDLIPTGLLIQSFDPTVKDSQIWTKLWQEATWGVLRPREKQRLPFKAMVGGTDPPEIDRIWKLLRDRPDEIVPLSSTQMLGVQRANNEGMSFTDRGSNYFLLHFWSHVAQIYLSKSILRTTYNFMVMRSRFLMFAIWSPSASIFPLFCNSAVPKFAGRNRTGRSCSTRSKLDYFFCDPYIFMCEYRRSRY